MVVFVRCVLPIGYCADSGSQEALLQLWQISNVPGTGDTAIIVPLVPILDMTGIFGI